MSAFFQALTVAVVFLIVQHLTRRLLPAIFGSLILAFVFPFWLFAEYAEVFGLNNFLASLIILFLVFWQQTQKRKYLYIVALIFGLALSNQHTIILLLPGILLFIFLFERKIFLSSKIFLILAILIISGLLFYLYVPIAAFFDPPLAWDNPTTFGNFLRLVSRRDYGIFVAVPFFAEAPIGRITHFLLYWGHFLVDFTFLGLGLLVLGAFSLFKSNKPLFSFLILSFVFTGFLFYMLANYPSVVQYAVGILDKFFLLSYIFAVIIISLGFTTAKGYLSGFGRKLKLKKISLNFLIIGVELVLFLLPLTLFLENFRKIDLSKNYFGEQIIEDIFKSTESNSVLLLQGDTVVSNSWYFHFAQNWRPDLKIIGKDMMIADWYYYETLAKQYPGLSIPESNKNRIADFVKSNVQEFPVFIYGAPPEVEGYSWIPNGVLLRLYQKDSVPSLAELQKKNQTLWSLYYKGKILNPPLEDPLLEYTAFFYSRGRLFFGNHFFNANIFDKAIDQYAKALEIAPEFLPARIKYASTFQELGECEEALVQFKLVLFARPDDVGILTDISKLYRDCFKNNEKALEFEEKARNMRDKLLKLPPLERF